MRIFEKHFIKATETATRMYVSLTINTPYD